jgi:transposase InsO family protein
MIRDQVLYCKDNTTHPYWRAILHRQLEYRVINYVHTFLGHWLVHVPELAIFLPELFGREDEEVCSALWRVSTCKASESGVWNWKRISFTKHAWAANDIGSLGHSPRCWGGVKYLLVCLEVFSKYVVLYPLKAATTKSCLNIFRTHYFPRVLQPQIILSDQGSQFGSPSWRKALAELGIQAKYSAIRHPESNPTERIMRELEKYFRIYCNTTHKKWQELVPYIEECLNSSVSETTEYAPTEFLGGKPDPTSSESY